MALPLFARIRVRPQSNTGTRIPYKFNARPLEGASDFLYRFEVSADGSPSQPFESADSGNSDPRLNRESVLLPSKKGPRSLNLSRDHKHLPFDPLIAAPRLEFAWC